MQERRADLFCLDDSCVVCSLARAHPSRCLGHSTVMRALRKRPLSIRDILAWATRYRETTGNWPSTKAGDIPASHGETWAAVDGALRRGRRGLPGGSSLAQLLVEKCGARNIQRLPPLTEPKILSWADAHHQHAGTYPTAHSGPIPDSGGEKWSSIDNALRLGQRGLPGGSSLVRLLAQHRGVRNRKSLPPLTEDRILAWADAHHQRTGVWPTAKSGPIRDAPGETWLAADMALHRGRRGLPGGSSLALLLAEKRDRRNIWTRPNLSYEQIVAWADAHHVRTGRWPNMESGPVHEAPGETWCAINHALNRGHRGLRGRSSLVELLEAERGVRNRMRPPPLSRKEMVKWATAHHQRTGRWPTMESGPIPEAPGDTWMTVDAALKNGRRGLHGISSLARLLDESGKKRNRAALPTLSYKRIVSWADAHFRRTGTWPKVTSGPVVDAPGERWKLIDSVLRAGLRGLPGGSSLAQLLARKRGVRNPQGAAPLSGEQILSWADRHIQRTGTRPRYKSGAIADTGETWSGIDNALRRGSRGLPGGSSLAKLLKEAGR